MQSLPEELRRNIVGLLDYNTHFNALKINKNYNSFSIIPFKPNSNLSEEYSLPVVENDDTTPGEDFENFKKLGISLCELFQRIPIEAWRPCTPHIVKNITYKDWIMLGYLPLLSKYYSDRGYYIQPQKPSQVRKERADWYTEDLYKKASSLLRVKCAISSQVREPARITNHSSIQELKSKISNMLRRSSVIKIEVIDNALFSYNQIMTLDACASRMHRLFLRDMQMSRWQANDATIYSKIEDCYFTPDCSILMLQRMEHVFRIVRTSYQNVVKKSIDVPDFNIIDQPFTVCETCSHVYAMSKRKVHKFTHDLSALQHTISDEEHTYLNMFAHYSQMFIFSHMDNTLILSIDDTQHTILNCESIPFLKRMHTHSLIIAKKNVVYKFDLNTLALSRIVLQTPLTDNVMSLDYFKGVLAIQEKHERKSRLLIYKQKHGIFILKFNHMLNDHEHFTFQLIPFLYNEKSTEENCHASLINDRAPCTCLMIRTNTQYYGDLSIRNLREKPPTEHRMSHENGKPLLYIRNDEPISFGKHDGNNTLILSLRKNPNIDFNYTVTSAAEYFTVAMVLANKSSFVPLHDRGVALL